MKYLLCGLFFLVFLYIPSQIRAADTSGVQTGAQLPSAKTIERLIPSQYGFQWLKYQYQLGTDTAVLTNFIDKAKAASRGKAGIGYKVLISIAKNNAGIETLTNPPYAPPREKCPPEGESGEWTSQYCPWPEELETTQCQKNCGWRVTGYDAYGQPILSYQCDTYTVTATPYPNGYLKFMNTLKDLAPYLSQVDAVEIWNEPNLTDEWTEQGLGPLSPENYVNFLNCGIKGLRKGGYTGKIISAAPSPNAPNGPTSMDTMQFFNAFIAAGGLNGVDYIGWHSNVTTNIPPWDSNLQGFQSVKYALNKGKPVWVTEFGWKRDKLEQKDDEAARKLQAQYIVDAYKEANTLGNIEAMAVFNFGFFKETGKFEFEDIEGTVPEGLLCQPNVQVPRQDYGDTIYVQDTTLRDDATISAVVAKALIPEIVNQDIAFKTGQEKDTQVEVVRSFFDTIKNTLSNILCLFKGVPFLGSWLGDLCQEPIPNISIGLKETEDTKENVPGQNTATLSATAKILGAISAPSEMELIAEKRDCNLGDEANLIDPKSGESRLVDTSAGFGTGAGFYGVDNPDFKTISPDVWETAMSARMIDQNLNIGNKLFSADRRSPDICLRQKDMIRGFYPEAVFPADISCDDVGKILQEINNSQFKASI